MINILLKFEKYKLQSYLSFVKIIKKKNQFIPHFVAKGYVIFIIDNNKTLVRVIEPL